jgi:hypothetical protein
MNGFHLVPAAQAGPDALGILVPPGRRTVLIVRPRALPWDLLVVRADRRSGLTTTFRDFGREEAAAAAEGLYAALQRWAAGAVVGQVETTRGEEGWLVRLQLDVFPLVACLRRAGQPYQPMVFRSADAAAAAAEALTGVLHPASDAGREVYFNDRHFTRASAGPPPHPGRSG